MSRIALAVVLSLAAHAAAALAISAVPRAAAPGVLFVSVDHDAAPALAPAAVAPSDRATGSPADDRVREPTRPAVAGPRPAPRGEDRRGGGRPTEPAPARSPVPPRSPTPVADAPAVVAPPTLPSSPAPAPPAATIPKPTVLAPPAPDSTASADAVPVPSRQTAESAASPPASADLARDAVAAPSSDSWTGGSARGGIAAGSSAGESSVGGAGVDAGGDGAGRAGADAGGGGAAVALAVPGDGGSGEYGGYLAMLRGRIQQLLRYPMAARRRGLSGVVQLEISVRPNGAIDDVAVVASSSHAVLDEAAVSAVRALGRVPFPAGVRPRSLRARLPVVFELQ